MAATEPQTPKSSARWYALGRHLIHYRKAKGLTQQQAADAAGFTLRHWQRLESGESGTEFEKIEAIAMAIDAPLKETYLKAGFTPPPKLSRGMSHSQKAAAIIESFPPEVQELAMASLESWHKLTLVKKEASDKQHEESERRRHPSVIKSPPEGKIEDLTEERLNGKSLKEETNGEQPASKKTGKKR